MHKYWLITIIVRVNNNNLFDSTGQKMRYHIKTINNNNTTGLWCIHRTALITLNIEVSRTFRCTAQKHTYRRHPSDTPQYLALRAHLHSREVRGSYFDHISSQHNVESFRRRLDSPPHRAHRVRELSFQVYSRWVGVLATKANTHTYRVIEMPQQPRSKQQQGWPFALHCRRNWCATALRVMCDGFRAARVLCPTNRTQRAVLKEREFLDFHCPNLTKRKSPRSISPVLALSSPAEWRITSFVTSKQCIMNDRIQRGCIKQILWPQFDANTHFDVL